MSSDYVHGYDLLEKQRLRDQATTLAELLHRDSLFAPGERVLEAGCGVGAQTLILAEQNPQASFVAVDISAQSLAIAQAAAGRKGLRNVVFQPADLSIFPSRRPRSTMSSSVVLEHLRKRSARSVG